MTQNPFQGMTDMMKNMAQGAKFDKEGMMATHRKNMEALTEANRMAVEVMKNIAQLQSQYIKQSFDDMASIMKDGLAHPPASKEAVQKNSDHMKDQVHRAFEHSATIGNQMADAQKRIFDMMHQRYNEGANEMIDIREKSKVKH